MSRNQRRRLLRQLRDSGFTVDAGATAGDLTIGFPPRAYNVGWPDLEARLLADWNRSREAVMAAADPGLRPWAYFWFDVAHGETIPGPTRDANLAAGRLTPAEAERMAYQHSLHAFGRIAASRPGQTTAEWLADPALIESATALCGWNPFTPDVIAHLRAREQERQAGRRIGRQKEEVPE
jgi:hypothetical protein